MQHEKAEQHADGGLQGHQCPERGRRQMPQGEHLQGERQNRQQDREARGGGEDAERQMAGRLRDADESRRRRCHRDGESQGADARETVADPLGEQDVDAPAGPRQDGEQDPERVDDALPGLGEQDDACQGEARPQQGLRAVAAEGGHGQRAEELDGHGRAEGDALDRREERDGHQPRRHAQAEQSGSVAAAKAPESGPADRDEEQRAHREAQPGGPGRAHLADEVDREGRAELHGEHRGDRERPGRNGKGARRCRGGHGRPAADPTPGSRIAMVNRTALLPGFA
ncbi:hypothetical protein GCM10025866_06090 [Naasia aerilata]|uniref:Uncharacterized protein n=1 Tax=Naasia aerilata TaxID=1162966 RepID=A0ABN6XLZ4_9MICO|nr:hypothetical protein GCM10025866_06090 [Naasia aerilata]